METSANADTTSDWENYFKSPFLDMLKCCVSDVFLNRRGGVIKIKDWRTSAPFHLRESCDRVTLCIPYCGSPIQWEVLFDYRNPSLPPDVVFKPGQSHFSPNIEKLYVLSKWNSSNPTMLTVLLKQLLNEFSLYNLEVVSKHPRLQFELKTFEESGNYNDIEVFCVAGEDDNDEIECIYFIPLSLDFCGLPKLNPSLKYEVALMVRLSSSNVTSAQTSIYISPNMQKNFPALSNMSLPVWGSDCEPCLMDFVPLVAKKIQEKIDYVKHLLELRKEFLTTWLSVYDKATLEYDTENYSFAAFLVEVKGFFCVLHFELTNGFPVEAPLITLRSVYHKIEGLPCESQLKHYIFNSQWTTEEMVAKLRKYLLDVIPKFRELSVAQGECLP